MPRAEQCLCQAPCGRITENFLCAARVPHYSDSHVAEDDRRNAALQVKDYKEDPLNFVGKVRARTGNELLKVLHQHATSCVAQTTSSCRHMQQEELLPSSFAQQHPPSSARCTADRSTVS